MFNYFVKVSGFPVKGQRRLRSVGGKRWGWGGWANWVGEGKAGSQEASIFCNLKFPVFTITIS